LLGFTLAVLSGVALADCPSGPDADGDGICDAVDNCIAMANPDQRDSYGPAGSPSGESGDACDALLDYPELNVVKTTLRGGAEGRGKAILKGDFILNSGETFAPSTVSVRVVDNIDLDLVAPDEDAVPAEPPLQCTTSGRAIRCKQPGQKTGVLTVASFVVSTTDPMVTRTVKFHVKVRRLSLSGTAFAEPVWVSLNDDSVWRVGNIRDCAPRNGSLRCRES
jgi:hypothetical protein